MTQVSQPAPLSDLDPSAAIGTSQAAVLLAQGASGGPLKSRYTVQSLVMGLRVLEALAKYGGLKGVTELARDLNTSKWVIFRHLHTLCDLGFAVRDPVSEKYEVGHRLHSLKDALPSRYVWVHRARADMMQLRQEVGLTVSVATPLEDRNGVIVVDVEAAGPSILYSLKLGTIFDYHSSAHGKAALAFGDPELLELIIVRGLRKATSRTVVNPNALRREINKVRERGWADAPEQAEINMNALVAPIFSGHGVYQGSIGIIGSIEQIKCEPAQLLVRSVVEAARRVSERLGGRIPNARRR